MVYCAKFVHVRWQADGQVQEADFCEECAGKLWREFKNSTLFNFSEPKDNVCVNCGFA